MTKNPRVVVLSALLLWVLLGAGCSTPPSVELPDWNGRPSPSPPGKFPNWPAAPGAIEPLFDGVYTLEAAKGTAAGTSGAKKVKIAFAGRPGIVRFKWKATLPWLDGINNSPRKEAAAFRIQRLFLDPEDYVVPTSFFRCVPLSVVHAFKPGAKSNLSDAECVLGLFSVWLLDVKLPERLYEPERFATDYVYAYYMANFNLLTYLIAHRDGREGNFMISADPARRQVFAIDNGVAFGGIFYNWFVPNWNDIRVPALRRDAVERLRELREEDLHALLGVLAQLERDDQGIYRSVEPGPNLDPDEGVRRQGAVLQFGLDDDEIEDIWERIEDLVEDVDEGRFQLF
jgi:hypothetical protein